MKRNRNFARESRDGDGKSREELLEEKVKIINERFSEYREYNGPLDAEGLISYIEEVLDMGWFNGNSELAAYHLLDVLEYLTGEIDKKPRSLAVYDPADTMVSVMKEIGDDQLHEWLYESGCYEDFIREGDIDGLKRLLKDLDDTYVPVWDYLNHRIDDSDHTGLWLAVTQPDPNIDMIKFLIDNGAKTDSWSDQGYPPHYSTVNYNMLEDALNHIKDNKKALEVAKILVGENHDLCYGWGLFDAAEENGNKELVEFLTKERGDNFSHRPLRRQFSNRRRRFYR